MGQKAFILFAYLFCSYSYAFFNLSMLQSRTWPLTMGPANIYGIATDSSANVYVIGQYTNTTTNASSVSDFSGKPLYGLSSTSSSDAFVAKIDHHGNLQWIQTLGGSGADTGDSIAVDSTGNVYVAGTFNNTSGNSKSVVDFSGATLPGRHATNTFNSYLAKLNSSGTQQWIRVSGAHGLDMKADSSGNTYVAGQFTNNTGNSNGVVDYAGATMYGFSSSASVNSAFIVKVNSAGTQQWIKTAGGGNTFQLEGVGVDGAGNVYATGAFAGNTDTSAFSGNPVDFAGSNVYGLGPSGFLYLTAIVVKFNSAGTQQWLKKMGGASSAEGIKMATDGAGNSYILGTFSNSSGNSSSQVDFAGAILYGYFSSATNHIFAAKVNSSGTQLWIKKMGGSYPQPYGIAFDTALNVYVAGSLSNSNTNANNVLDFAGSAVNGTSSTASTDGFLAKLSSTGAETWIQVLGGKSSDVVNAVAIDSVGTYHIAGYFNNSNADVNLVKTFNDATLRGRTSSAANCAFIIQGR